MTKMRMATVWLDGCSGCHMSFLDLDDRLLAVAEKADLVYSPLVDCKDFPLDVDIALVEGAISSDEDLHKIQVVRQRTKTLVSLGDCAVTANVPSMRNQFPLRTILDRAYQENVTLDPGTPTVAVPALLEKVRPVHEVVPVDVFIPGCPPSADTIFYAVSELLEGRSPDLGPKTHFGS